MVCSFFCVAYIGVRFREDILTLLKLTLTCLIVRCSVSMVTISNTLPVTVLSFLCGKSSVLVDTGWVSHTSTLGGTLVVLVVPLSILASTILNCLAG